MVRRDLADRAVAAKLFDTIAPRFSDRPGGYTRLLRIGFRRGDAAEMAQVELIGSEYNPDLEKSKGESKPDETPERQPEQQSGGRLRRMFRGRNKR